MFFATLLVKGSFFSESAVAFVILVYMWTFNFPELENLDFSDWNLLQGQLRGL
mgnify:CR=1 FL=1